MDLFHQYPEKSFEVVYENQDLLIVNKPFFLPTAVGVDPSLCDYLFSSYPYIKSVNGFNKNDGGLLNRLDNETGGIVLFAKNNDAFLYFRSVLSKGLVSKYYNAMVEGIIPQKNGIINKKIAHHNRDTKKMVIVDDNKHRSKERNALTEWEFVDSNDYYSMLNIRIKKGCRHQIRLHLSSIGFPIVNDKIYNKISPINPNFPHFLFAYRVIIPYYNDIIDVSINTPFSLIKSV